jgi:hypothetical protein
MLQQFPTYNTPTHRYVENSNVEMEAGVNLPFTVPEFFEVFARYNQAVWPIQIMFVVIAVVAAIAVWAQPVRYSRVVLLILAALWAWIGVVYHAMFFRSINPAAALFAALFIAQAASVCWQSR